MPPFIQNLLALPAKTKAILGVSFVAIVAIAFIMLKIATAPAYSLIVSGLDPAQTGKITAALDEQGIAYELQNNGTALAVQKASTAQARIALATAGVQATGGAQPGYELLDESKLGASQFQQQVTYQRALEGEIARTLSGVQGVSNPTVQIVMPQDDLFQDEATPATAAIQLGNSSDTLAPGAVRGMAQSAAASVKGLKSENVTITDSTGAILWPSDDANGSPGGSSKASAEARYARQLESSINAMLTSTLGPNMAKVTINADLNVDKASSEELTYADKGVPLTQSEESETMKGGSANSGGTAGTGSNVPTYSGNAGSGSAGSGNYDRKKTDTNFGVNKKITKTETAPGAVNKLNVALLVDKSVPAPVFQSLQKTVATAAGLDQTTRGDTITATQMAFVKAATPKAGPVPTTMLGPLKWVGLGLAALLFLFFMARGMKKRENENLGTPAWLTTIDEPVSLAQLEAGAADTNFVANTSTLTPRVPDASLHQLDQLMEREPERVAAQVKAWMAED